MISNISHITFIVKNLEHASFFLKKIFEAEEVYSSGDNTFSLSREKFFLIGDIWICIMEGEPLLERSYNHIAFKIDERDIDDYIARIKGVGAEIRPERKRIGGEGRSVYFYDFNNHLFELHSGTLTERLATYSYQIAAIKED